MTKTKIALIALAMCCIALLAAGTMAYFTVEDTAYNVVTTAKLDMELVEETTDKQPFPDDGISGVMPGATVGKVVYVRNIDNVDFWTRVKLTARLTKKDGEPKVIPLDELGDEYISLVNLDTENWIEHEDGWFYYNHPVTDETTPLITGVEFDKHMPNDYQECQFELDVYAQAVQSKHNGETVLDAKGWPADETQVPEM